MKIKQMWKNRIWEIYLKEWGGEVIAGNERFAL
jgi:hypothetical protein